MGWGKQKHRKGNKGEKEKENWAKKNLNNEKHVFFK